MRRLITLVPLVFLAACATVPQRPAAPIEVQLLAFNDFHGNLEMPAPVEVTEADGSTRTVASGGAAHLAAAIEGLRRPNSVTVSAGDTIGASPLTSALFLDEPTIEAMNRIGLEFNSVGNHEFDRGVDELKRVQTGGCGQFTRRTPCAVEPFRGAGFKYLAANVVGSDGRTILPATGVKTFGRGRDAVTIGFIGMTLKATGSLVTPSGVKGLTFTDEASTANLLVPGLKARGADTIVLLIHQGGKLPTFSSGNGCDGLYGEILPILDKLDPAIATVVSGHTHWAYVCNRGAGEASGGRLLTSAGKNGYFVTDVRLIFDPASHRLIAQRATNNVVGNGERGEDAGVKALVDRYVAAAAPLANRVVGRLSAAAPRSEDDSESPAADLIADAMLAATRDPAKGGAQIALVNATGVRVTLPAGEVRYRDAFAMMPFGNNLVVATFTGAQIKAGLEQQYAGKLRAGASRPAALAPSQGFFYVYDVGQPAGQRISRMSLDGKPIDPARRYRVVLNNYLASGGDGLTALAGGTDIIDEGIIDIDALIAWIAPGRVPPVADRVRGAAGADPR